MDIEQARRRLPEAHGQALQLRDQGLTNQAIARLLAIPPHAVPSLLQIAEAKLERLLNETDPNPTSTTGHQGTSDTT